MLIINIKNPAFAGFFSLGGDKIIKIPKEIKMIMNKLEENCFDAYIVGGAVRDSLLGEDPSDYDLTTNARPEELLKIFKDYKTIDIGKKFGTILVIYNSMGIEITTYRFDGKYVDGRRPESVEFSDDLIEDLKRRDFTINAMAYNPTVGLIDYFDGEKDLENKIVKSVGNPIKRFEEDHLRILRAIRFATELNFTIENETKKACKKLGNKLVNISSERIRDEFFKIMMSNKPSLGIELMRETKILELLFPEIYMTIDFDQKNPHHKKDLYMHTLSVLDNAPKDLETRLAALFHDLGKVRTMTIDEEGIGRFYGHHEESVKIAKKRLEKLNTSNKIIKSVLNLIDRHMINNKCFKTKGIKRLIRKMGEKDVFKLMDLQKADRVGQGKSEVYIKDIIEMENKIIDILEKEEVYEERQLAIDGNDVIELGCSEGKIIGEILRYALDIVLENPEYNKKDILLKEIKENYNIGGK